MKIAVIGAGGVGGYFAARLAAGGAEVHVVARGSHLEAIQRDGLRIRSPLGDAHARVVATDDPSVVGPCDYVLLCVKAYDTQSVTRRLPATLHAETAVVSLQNGVDNEDIVAETLGPGHVMGGAAFILSTIAEPGCIAHTGGPARIIFGELDGTRSDRSERLLREFEDAGVEARLSDAIRTVLWDKMAFICAQAGLTAVTRLPIGELRDIEETRAMFRDLASEVRAVAAAEGVALPDEAVENHLQFADGLEPASHSSLHHDLSNGRRLELEALHGAIVRRAGRHGVDVPMHRAVYALLKPWMRRNGDGVREPARGGET